MSNTLWQLAADAAPERSLRPGFTKQTLLAAVAAKRRSAHKNIFHRLSQGEPTVKLWKFLHTLPGIAIAAVVVSTGTFSAYAVNANWFNTSVEVRQTSDPSIITVQAPGCTGVKLDVDSVPIADKQVQFKVTSGHASPDEIEKALLPLCELQSVRNFYQAKFPTLFVQFGELNEIQSPNRPKEGEMRYDLVSGTIKNVTSTNATIGLFDYCKYTDPHFPVPCKSEITFPLTTDATFYNQGKSTSASSLHTGDAVLFVATTKPWISYGPDTKPAFVWRDLDDTTKVVSIFKTEYDLQKPVPMPANVEPLSDYKILQKESAAYRKAMLDPVLRQK